MRHPERSMFERCSRPGVVWTEMDGTGGWQRNLLQGLELAGYDVD
jgi:hypothetical protein